MRVKGSKWLFAGVMALGFGAGCESCSETSACFDEDGNEVLCVMPDMVPDLSIDLARDEGMQPEPDAAPDLPQPDTDMTPVDMCQPMARGVVCNNICGMQPDGCGGVIDCGQPLTPAEACQGACGMQSDGCGGMVDCEPCACENGQPLEPRCGVCQLGRSACDGDTFSCESYEIPGLTQASDCDSDIIYVNGRSMADTPDGSLAAPFTTLADATAAASERGARVILVGGGSTDKYNETLNVIDGTSVHGGWNVDWLPDATRTPIIEPLKGDTPSDVFGARAIDIVDRDTLVAYFQIKTPDIDPSTDGPGFNNYGFYARNAQTLRLEHLDIEVGRGGNGAAGDTGVKGMDGQNGKDGRPGSYSDSVVYNHPVDMSVSCTDSLPCSLSFPASGGSGAINREDTVVNFNMCSMKKLCDDTRGVAYVGGDGGAGGFQYDSVDTFQSGSGGVSGAGGAQGGLSGNVNRAATAGQNGAPVISFKGVDGGVVTPSIMTNVSNGLLVSNGDGQKGGPGINGNGGGGGGGAVQMMRTITFTERTNALDTLGATYTVGGRGASGGGGGGGGCGGDGGGGGFAAGSSIGLAIMSSKLSLSDSLRIRSGAGGVGGRGGQGGDGGSGGSGGNASMQMCQQSNQGPFQLFLPCQTTPITYFGCDSLLNADLAGSGGSGSKGQVGGYGGGGSGGHSIGVLCTESTLMSRAADIESSLGGSGGFSDGNSGLQGLSVKYSACD